MIGRILMALWLFIGGRADDDELPADPFLGE